MSAPANELAAVIVATISNALNADIGMRPPEDAEARYEELVAASLAPTLDELARLRETRTDNIKIEGEKFAWKQRATAAETALRAAQKFVEYMAKERDPHGHGSNEPSINAVQAKRLLAAMPPLPEVKP